MRPNHAPVEQRHDLIRVIVAAFILAYGASVAATCTPNCPPPPSTWMMVHGDETNASYNPNETTLTWTRLQSGVLSWVAAPEIQSTVLTLVATGDSVVYTEVSGLAIGIYSANALSLATGAQRWNLARGNSITAKSLPVAVTYGTRTYVSLLSGNLGLEAYDTVKGTALGGLPGTLGQVVAQGAAIAAPVAANGIMYYARLDGSVSAVSTSTGVALWSLPQALHRIYLNQLAVGAARLYVTQVINPGQNQAQSNVVLALDAQTGSLLWSHSFPTTQFVSAPVYQQGSVYLKTRTVGFTSPAAANTIVRLDAATGVQMASTASLGVPLTNLAAVDQSPTVGAGHVVVQGVSNNPLNPHTILVLDAATLAKQWEHTLTGSTDGLYDFTRAPTIANDFTVACTGGVLRAWKTADGSEGLFNLSALSCAGQPIVAGGKLIYFNPNAGSLSGQLTALAPAGP